MTDSRSISSNERVYMCIRVLEDGERERATHFRVVDAGAYEELLAEVQKLRASAHETGPSLAASADYLQRYFFDVHGLKYSLDEARVVLETALKQDVVKGSEPLTIGKLILETARGDTKERVLTPSEAAELRTSIAKALEPIRAKYRRVSDETIDCSAVNGSAPPCRHGTPAGRYCGQCD